MASTSGNGPQSTYGAPPSLALQAQRTAEQEELIAQVTALKRQARALCIELETTAGVDYTALKMGRAFLRFGCMSLVHAITRNQEDL